MGPQDADDSLQSLFLRVVRRGRLTEVDEPERYLTRAQTRVFTTYWSRRSRVEVPVEDAAVEEADSATLGERLERLQDAELVRRCLPLLKARHRAVLSLHMSGFSRETIAEELGLSPHAVTQLTRRALDALNHRLRLAGYVRGFLPLPVVSWFRQRGRASADFFSRYSRAIEGLIPVTVIAMGSIIPPAVSQERSWVRTDRPTPAASSQSSATLWLDPGSLLTTVPSRSQVETGTSSSRRRAVEVEENGTRVWVDQWEEERPEPPLDEQIRDLLNDPGRAFPSCPNTTPCPWRDV